MVLLFERVKQFCLTQGWDKTYWIAYSGGLDSHVLLHVCSKLREIYPLRLHAVYINHGLSPHANRWGEHAARICHALDIPFKQKNITVKITENSEETARDHRYLLLSDELNPQDFLLTAHHKEDQAETVMIQLLRGAGPKGLAAMPIVKSLGKGVHGRPFLDVHKAELKKYAKLNQLHYIEDESNDNIQLARNFLRHEVFPVLKKRWPSAVNTLARVAENCAAAQTLISEMAAADLSAIKGSLPHTISIQKLKQLDQNRQTQVLRVWFKKHNEPLPSAAKMQQIRRHFLHARGDKAPHIIWGNVECRRYRDDLYVMRSLKKWDNTQSYRWDFSQPLQLHTAGTLRGVITTGTGLHAGIKEVTVCFRKGGENCRLPGRVHHHALKKLFQQWGVPHWMRERIPLLYVEDVLVGVVGFFIDEEFSAKNNEKGIVIYHDY